MPMPGEDYTSRGFKSAFGGVLGIAFACVFIIGSCTAVSCGSCAMITSHYKERAEEEIRRQDQQQTEAPTVEQLPTVEEL